jgi:hypothetical protein
MEDSRNHPIDCGLATTSNFSRSFAKQTIANRTLDINLVVEYKELQSGSSSSVAVGDINYTRVVYPVSGTNYRVQPQYLPEKFSPIKSLTSSNESVITQSPSDPLLFEYQSSGTSLITTELFNGEKSIKSATTSTTTSSTQDNFINFQNGSLGKHIFDGIRNYADNSTLPPNHYPIYSTFNQLNNIYVKNTNNWASGLDFSGLMVNKNGSAGVTMVTAITPHHAIGAAHYAPQVGDIIYFCNNTNQTIQRTISDVEFLATGLDCCIVKFTEALPESVKKYKTLPQNYRNYLPLNKNYYSGSTVTLSRRGSYLPMIITSHYRWDSSWPLQRSNRYAYVAQTDFIADAVNFDSIAFIPAFSEPNNFPDYNGQPSGIRGGDSGGPCFFVINNDLVLVHCHFSGGGGPFHPSFLSSIQAKIDELGPSGQTYQTVDLSSFTDFSS